MVETVSVQKKGGKILNVLPLQIILNEKSLIIKLFSLKIGDKENQDTEVNWKIVTSWKKGKGG